ncbi:MAG: RagB/SusD family nutrient uptake outer membrane protein [Prevotella sp.]
MIYLKIKAIIQYLLELAKQLKASFVGSLSNQHSPLRGDLGGLLVLFLLTSCLSESPRDQIDQDAAYSSATTLYDNTVATLYNYMGGTQASQGLQGTYRGVYDYNSLTTDECIIPIRGGDWYDGGFWQDLYLHSWTASDQSLEDTWNYLYKVINLSNKTIEDLNSHKSLLTDAQLTTYTAEARAVRAMFYWYTMDMWGNIPLITSTSQSLANTSQSKRSVLYKFIWDELQAVEPLLPNEKSNLQGDYYGRMTRPVVDFLLAKLALNYEVYADDDRTDGVRPSGSDASFTVDGQTMNAWQACVYYCDKLTADGYTLMADRTANFSVHNENSTENIFVIPMDKTLYTQQFQNLFRSRHYAHGGAYGTASENGTCATLATVHDYGYGTDSVDTRWNQDFYSDTVYVDGKTIALDGGGVLVYYPLEVTSTNLTYSKYIRTAGARMKKYEVDRTAYNDGKNCDNDIVLFRYADAVLMRAEAHVRNGESGQADLDAIRSRVGMPSRKATLTNILRERRMELMWEGWRRNDLIRYGLFNKAYDIRPQLDGEASGYTTVFPIPAKVLALNTKLEQNRGYK